MSYLVPDFLETLSMKEVNGVIRSMTRVCRIGDLPASTDYTTLMDAYEEVGLPAPGSFLTTVPFPTPNPPVVTYPLAMLVLASREFKLLDKGFVDVHLHYEHFMDGDNQVLTPNPDSPNFGPSGVQASPVVYGKNRASVSQSKTNFYYTNISAPAWVQQKDYLTGTVVDFRGFFWMALVDMIGSQGHPGSGVTPPGPPGTAIGTYWGIVTEQQIIAASLLPVNPMVGPEILATPVRRQIAVGHQFPWTGPSRDRDVPGQTLYQTGEITEMQPNDNFKLHGQVFTRNPRAIKKAILRAINSIPWMDEGAYEWMCTEVTWEPLYAQWQWKMGFEFQHNPDSWIPTAIFNDQRTGRPPANVLENFGYRNIHKHPEVDFENYFQVTFGCAPMAGA